MKLFKASLLAAILSFGAPVAAQAPPITDRFTVNVANNQRGGCAYVGLDRLNRIFDDCVTLADYGILAMDDYRNDARFEARRLVSAFFKSDTIVRRNEIRDRFRRVRDWILNGGPVDNGRNNRMPYLTCHHDWEEVQLMTDTARDMDGDSIRDENGLTMRIRDIDVYTEVQRRLAQGRGVSVSEIFPYWSRLFNFYNFDIAYGANPGDGYCTPRRHLGRTQLGDYPVVTLCPQAFRASSRTDSSWTYRPLHAVGVTTMPLDSLTENNRPDPSAHRLTRIEPEAATLFHELFHLVLGNGIGETAPPDFPDEEYRLGGMLDLDYQNAVCNPETFAKVATAYDYTRNSDSVDGQYIEFFAGFATRGDT
ncbi:hypothetical protein S40293_10607 [Stachybotrys chartarum IBT 40293]|nr:hypothetical protein S40293_10607 [Stachybotrys chartarum IBT 40293]KFA81178.1 hypothetical protein S40288_10548 [Stachybotrys chartarum IBT 40288]